MDIMKLKVKIEDQAFDVELGDLNARPVLVNVDGESFEVYPEEGDSRPESAPSASSLTTSAAATAPATVAPAAAPAGGGARVVNAPIPGTIVGVSVKVGDSITFGQELCVLEAMKMKNIIRATRTGKISAIHVSKGVKVKQGEALLEFAD
jgi:glutaconyl-CoA/methylmalonyl-CoA decarboxylase subunit gamma